MSATQPASRPLSVRPAANALPRWQHRTVVWGAWSLALSGAAWLAVHYGIRAGTDTLPHPLEAWLMRWHALSAVAGLFAAGLVGATHVPRGWQLGRQRASGLALCIGGAVVVLSGYALAYLLPESWHAGVGIGHAALGALAFAVGFAHARLRR